jgi:hypothetical protein
VVDQALQGGLAEFYTIKTMCLERLYLLIYRVIPDVQKHDFLLFLVDKFEQNPVPFIYRETPLFLELPMKPVGIEPRIERILSKERDMLIGEHAQPRI